MNSACEGRPPLVQRIKGLFTNLDIPVLAYKVGIRLKRLDFGAESTKELGLSDAEAHGHGHSGGPVLDRVLRSLSIPPDSWCIDLGSGKGMGVITLAKHFSWVWGIELSRRLHEIARDNCRKTETRNVKLSGGTDAAVVRYDLDQFNYIYMFNPFPDAVMREVARNLIASVRRRPRKVTVIYNHPACHGVLVEAGFIVKQTIVPKGSHPFVIYEVPGGGDS